MIGSRRIDKEHPLDHILVIDGDVYRLVLRADGCASTEDEAE